MRKITNKNEALNELIRGKENIYYIGDESALNEYIRISKDSLNMLITSVIESESARRGCLDIYTLLSGQEETKGEKELFEEELVLKDVAEFSQLPIIPADMISYRMSRGVQFDSIEFSPITKYEGEFYNYISHAKSRNGIKLTTKISDEDVKINTDIIECYLDS